MISPMASPQSGRWAVAVAVFGGPLRRSGEHWLMKRTRRLIDSFTRHHIPIVDPPPESLALLASEYRIGSHYRTAEP
jgi:hypothetical protein